MDEERTTFSDDESLADVDDQVSQLMAAQTGVEADELQDFWSVASRYARLGDLEVFMGTPWSEALAPEAWSFGDSADLANELLALVLAGKKTATTGLYQEYVDEEEPLPKVGDLSIILDGASHPRALVRDQEVVITTFGDVTPEQAAAEGEGDRTLESWRQAHREVWERRGLAITDDTKVVWERFKVLYSV
ncbi:MAG: ASCH domain-containing protein [Propionibacteriaceae bacterium]|jgi:uncharacterized protein YhfF|nr:ASCH domain-containing protein [Propionibacteriaceae bacterium]